MVGHQQTYLCKGKEGRRDRGREAGMWEGRRERAIFHSPETYKALAKTMYEYEGQSYKVFIHE